MPCRASTTVLWVVIWFAVIPARGTPAERSGGGTASGSEEIAAEAIDEATFVAFDDFKGKLELDWKPVRPDPTHASLTKHPDNLTITTQRGSIHLSAETNRQRGAPPTKNMYFVDNPLLAEPGFVVTTCLDSFRPTVPYQQAGLMVINDEDNYVKWVCESSNSGVPILNLLREVESRSSITKFPIEGDFQRLWLCLTKRGNHYEFAYSTDGESFAAHGELPWGDGSPKRIGLVATNGGSANVPELDARFDSFELRSLNSAEKSEPGFVERQKLQGTWKVVSCALNGNRLKHSALSKFVFEGGSVAITEKTQVLEVEYTLDLTRDPKGFVLSALSRQTQRPVNGVYSLDGEALVICLALQPDAPAD